MATLEQNAATAVSATKDKEDEELARRMKRAKLKTLNLEHAGEEPQKALDSSLKRHTALIKRMRQSLGAENYDQIMKDVQSLTLEKYVEEIAGAVIEGIARCKSEKDVWSAVEVISSLHRRFPRTFTPKLLSLLSAALAPPQRPSAAATSTNVPQEQREKEDAARVTRQRPVLRVCSELALVGIIRDSPSRSGGEWIMKTLKDLLSNDPSLSSLPLLTTFLKSFSRPFLGITPPASTKQQIQEGTSTEAFSSQAEEARGTAEIVSEADELVEKEIRVRFKRMCEGYYENVSKKLVKEHKHLQEQDKRNHEAYIRSGEIFEDRQQAYEKLTKAYERLLQNCQTLSELLYLPMPELPSQSQKTDSIIISSGAQSDAQNEIYSTGGKWEDEEERKFFEDLQDLRDCVPKSMLGLDDKDGGDVEDSSADKEKERRDLEELEVKELEEELRRLEMDESAGGANNSTLSNGGPERSTDTEDTVDEDDAATPVPSPPKSPSPPHTPTLAPQGPSQLLTALLARLPDATNRTLIDQAAIDFAFLNSKAARKRLVKFLTQVPKNRIDILPHYSRLVATLNKYMPDIGTELVAALEEEFRYLQRKKNVTKELAETRMKNIAFLSNLTKFRVVPTHVILHIFKVCLDDFSGVNVENLALLMEGCGRFLLRSEETRERFGTMIELMRRKQNRQHLDQRQLLLLENAYYQCNPPERTPRQEKQRSPMEQFIRHLIYDVLAKKTIDKVLKLIRKLDWNDKQVVRTLHNCFTKVWKVRYSHVSLLAMLVYDLQRYHPEFAVNVVDQVLENVRRGLETNVYNANQQRVATVKYLGELYIYRMLNSGIIFDTLWSLVTFGHPEGRPLPGQSCPIDMPDDFFRIRLVCVILDTCGMCFERGSQKRKLENFLTFFQMYVFSKEALPMDVEFMLEDSFEALNPRMVRFKSFDEASHAVDEMFAAALHSTAGTNGEGDDSGEESEDDGEDIIRGSDEDEAEDDDGVTDNQLGERAPSPDTLVLLTNPEKLGPTEEEDNDFAKELAKMVTDASTESRKVDKRTAQVLWDTATLVGLRKKKVEQSDSEDESENTASDGQGTMKFMLLTRKGNKQQAKKIAIPAASALATHTRSAQEQDKEEQQQLKRLVLDYEQREEIEELKALEARSRNSGIRIRNHNHNDYSVQLIYGDDHLSPSYAGRAQSARSGLASSAGSALLDADDLNISTAGNELCTACYIVWQFHQKDHFAIWDEYGWVCVVLSSIES